MRFGGAEKRERMQLSLGSNDFREPALFFYTK